MTAPFDDRDDERAQDEALERLRGADPAAGIEPSQRFAALLAGRISRATEDDDGAAPDFPAGAAAGLAGEAWGPVGGDPDDDPDDGVDAGADVPGDHTDEAATTAPPADRRRPPHHYLAAAAAAVALVAGGFVVGTQVGGGQEYAAAPISLSSSQRPAYGSEGMGVSGGGIAFDWMAGLERVSFSAAALGTQEGEAAGYGLDISEAATPERLQEVTTALGFEGTPTFINGSWSLHDSGSYFNAYPSDVIHFSVNGPSPDRSSAYAWCEECEVDGDGTNAFTDGTESASASPDERGEAALRQLILTVGEDPGQFTYEPPDTGAAAVGATGMVATRVVDGQETTTLTFGIDLNSRSYWGYLGDVVTLGTYPVVSEQEGFDRLSDRRFAATRSAWPPFVNGEYNISTEDGSNPLTVTIPDGAAPPAPSPGPVAWPVAEVTLSSARLGLAVHHQPDGTALLLPAYEFADDDGNAWSVIAVAEEALDLAGG